MKECPLLRKPCEKIKCQWWMVLPEERMLDIDIEKMDGKCAVEIMAEEILYEDYQG